MFATDFIDFIEMAELILASPGLPLELWWKIFHLLPIQEKLSSSQEVVEFDHFFRSIFGDRDRYWAEFTDVAAARASSEENCLAQFPGWSDLCDLPSINFSIFLLAFDVDFLDSYCLSPAEGAPEFKLVEFECDTRGQRDTGYKAYLKVNAVCWFGFTLRKLRLPTGQYNILFRMRVSAEYTSKMFEITLKHENQCIPQDVGYLVTPELDETTLWQWVPVYADIEATTLLMVKYDFEDGDWCSSLSLSSRNDLWTRGLDFSYIRFACINKSSRCSPVSGEGISVVSMESP